MDKQDENEDIKSALMIAIAALNLVAAPKRTDGTYNRNREACEQVARQALDHIMSLTGA
jgi:hypothetical protein